MLCEEDVILLEGMIHRHSLSQVLDALHNISGEKAEYARTTRQDERTVRAWEGAGRELDILRERVSDRFGL